MEQTAHPLDGLVTDPSLHKAWQVAAPGSQLLGIAGATAAGQGAVVVVSATPVDDAIRQAAVPGLAAVLGVRSVEVVVAPGSSLSELVRDWTYQAGQGSGRGVHVKVVTPEGQGDTAGPDTAGPDTTGPIRVLVRAIDSSARELALRLASPHDPALPALRALLGGRAVTVEDAEDPSSGH